MSLKTVVYPWLDPTGRLLGRPLIRDKTHADGELVHETETSQWRIEQELSHSKYRRHTWLSTAKYVEVDGVRYYESSSWVYWPEGRFGDWQHHCYIIPVELLDTVRLYHHKEPSITRPRAHQNAAANQVDGDPDGHLRDALSTLHDQEGGFDGPGADGK